MSLPEFVALRINTRKHEPAAAKRSAYKRRSRLEPQCKPSELVLCFTLGASSTPYSTLLRQGVAMPNRRLHDDVSAFVSLATGSVLGRQAEFPLKRTRFRECCRSRLARAAARPAVACNLNRQETESKKGPTRAKNQLGEGSRPASKTYGSSGATPKRLESIEGSRKFRYIAGNKGPDIWLVVAILSILLPILFIAWAFKTGIVDPSGY